MNLVKRVYRIFNSEREIQLKKRLLKKEIEKIPHPLLKDVLLDKVRPNLHYELEFYNFLFNLSQCNSDEEIVKYFLDHNIDSCNEII